MPKPTHIAETALYVDDLDRAIQFYTDLFKCPMPRRDERFCALRIAADQVFLIFLRGRSVQPVWLKGGMIPGHDGSGSWHVCFGIRGEDLAEWECSLKAQGITVESAVRWPGGATSLYFRDPDHHLIELATPGLWE